MQQSTKHNFSIVQDATVQYRITQIITIIEVDETSYFIKYNRSGCKVMNVGECVSMCVCVVYYVCVIVCCECVHVHVVCVDMCVS